MKVLFEYCHGCGKHPNEDAYGYCNNTFWVIDGATDVFNDNYLSETGDVLWIVQKLNSALKEKSSLLSLKEMLKSSIESVKEEAVNRAPVIETIPLNQLPTFAICCARVNQDALEYLCLGDCSLFCSKEPLTRYSDSRILPFHYQVNAVKEQYKDSQSEYAVQVIKKVRDIKKYINVEEGYWIGTLDSNIAEKSIEGYIHIVQGDRFMICSDGFRPSIDEAGLVNFSPNDIFDKARLKQLLQKQLVSEGQYQLETGISISDDKTVLLIEI